MREISATHTVGSALPLPAPEGTSATTTRTLTPVAQLSSSLPTLKIKLTSAASALLKDTVKGLDLKPRTPGIQYESKS